MESASRFYPLLSLRRKVRKSVVYFKSIRPAFLDSTCCFQMTLVKLGCDDIPRCILYCVSPVAVRVEIDFLLGDSEYYLPCSLLCFLLQYFLISPLCRFFLVDSHYFLNNLVTYVNCQCHIQVHTQFQY